MAAHPRGDLTTLLIDAERGGTRTGEIHPSEVNPNRPPPASLLPSPFSLGTLLEGRWYVRRDVTSPDQALIGRFTGEGLFSWQSTTELSYVEYGTFVIADRPLEVHRTLTLEFASSGEVSIRFHNDNVVHPLQVKGAVGRSAFLCGDDRYDGVFCIRSQREFIARWRVIGPLKQYRSTSVSRRAEPPLESTTLDS